MKVNKLGRTYTPGKALGNDLRRLIITPPARRAWRSYKFAPFLGFFFRVESRRTAHG